ncbi:hypothetical protein J2858_000715 [Neorhizobium galegae]|uniref:hypothetical protein n=1 Tax=Neorhizobium galegae TaxID=399 RepID=UPI001AE70A48|nr:hypothetical protein [Neorhizobium galegae]MBP2547822.1 hypothetical protein [Neorhizobium galegae]
MNVKTTIELPEILADITEELRRRAALPAEEWQQWDGEALSSRVKARLDEKYRPQE